MNALFAAIPGIGNVLLVSLLFWLIFSILGVHLFAGKFYKCVDADNEALSASVVPNKAECLKYPDQYRWVNSKVTFDNVLAGFLALMQVVSIFTVKLYIKTCQKTWVRSRTFLFTTSCNRNYASNFAY